MTNKKSCIEKYSSFLNRERKSVNTTVGGRNGIGVELDC